MSDVKRCDKCGEIVNAKECYKATYMMLDSEGNIFDDAASHACENCRDEVNLGVTQAMSK